MNNREVPTVTMKYNYIVFKSGDSIILRALQFSQLNDILRRTQYYAHLQFLISEKVNNYPFRIVIFLFFDVHFVETSKRHKVKRD